jgi:hypothetical protein
VNFLALVNRLKDECGVTGDDLTTVIGATGESRRLVRWINAAWMELQAKHEDWQWMRQSFSFVTIASQYSYTAAQAGITDFGMWDRYNFRQYNTAAGTNSEVEMTYIGWQQWRDTYLIGANRNTTSMPLVATITPDKQLAIGPVPAAGYTITGYYFQVPSEMALDADIPSLPTQFHMLIVYEAMKKYAGYEAASEVYQRSVNEGGPLLRQLALSRLPEITLGSALA